MSPWATAPQNHRGEAGRHRLAAPARAEVFKPEKLKWMLRFSEGHWFPWASLGLVRQKQLLTFHTQSQEEQNQSSLQVEHGKGMLA